MRDDKPVNWAGRTFGELTPDEKRRAARAAGNQLSDELTASADAIGAVLSQPLYPEVTVQLSGQDGNTGSIVARVRDAMRRAGVPDYGTVMSHLTAEIFKAGSYDESLNIVMRYVTVT